MFDCSELLFKNAAPVVKSKDPVAHTPLRRSYASLVTLIEQHRKLDRSVSEPTSRYKTELCRPFEESGACKYGDKCQFAHGYSELRNLARHPKYKTELCRTFHTIGFCPYGPRCHFIHNFEEARIHNQKVSAQLGQAQPNIMGLSPIIGNSNGSVNSSSTILEQIATVPQINQISGSQQQQLMRSSSLGSGGAYNPSIMRTNSLSISPVNGGTQNLQNHHQHQHQSHHQHQHQHHHNHQVAVAAAAATSVIGSRPKPLNLSPTFSLGSTADSVSPSSSLSQSPTNSMASFFSDEVTTPFSFGQDFGLLTRHSPSPQGQSQIVEDPAPRTPSPLSPNAESRLPVFNRISNPITDFDNLKI